MLEVASRTIYEGWRDNHFAGNMSLVTFSMHALQRGNKVFPPIDGDRREEIN